MDAREAPTARPLRSGIIGCGFMGEVHAHAVRAAGGVVAAAAGSSPATAEAGALRLGAQRAAGASELLAADDIDIVHVCTPNHVHVSFASAALAAGKHVICEKPLATELVGAGELLAAAEEAGTVTAVPFGYRFHPLVREARRRVRHGEAGDVWLVHGSYLQDWLARAEDDDWRADPGTGGASRAFADIGVHWCDLAEFVTGHRIARLSARLRSVHGRRTEDAATVQFETDGGALGSVVVSQVSPGRKNGLWLSVDGAAASVVFDQELPDSLWLGTVAQDIVVRRGTEGSRHPRYDRLPPGHPQGYQDCFNSFVADVHSAIRGEVPEGLPTFRDGYRAAVLTAAVLDSAKTGTWIEVH